MLQLAGSLPHQDALRHPGLQPRACRGCSRVSRLKPCVSHAIHVHVVGGKVSKVSSHPSAPLSYTP